MAAEPGGVRRSQSETGNEDMGDFWNEDIGTLHVGID